MPITHHHEPNDTIVCMFAGDVLPADVLAWYDRLRADPDFNPDGRQIAEFKLTAPPQWSADDMRRVLEFDPFGAGARRAFIGDNDLVFALARMFASFAESTGRGGTMRVFRTRAEADGWLASLPS